MTNSHTHDIAEELLATAVTVLTDAGITPPPRQFVAAGEVADECDSLTVALTEISQGLPGLATTSIEPYSFAFTGSYQIRIVRCVTQEDRGPLDPDDLTLDAEATYSDAWVLVLGLATKKESGDLLAKCDSMVIANALPFGPEGGIAGWQINVLVQL